MASQITVSTARGPVVREFTLVLPEAWQDWMRQAAAAGRRGLPIVVALHDAGDPEAFQRLWDFTQVWASSTPRRLDDQFILVYLHGWSSADAKAIPATATLPTEPDDVAVPAGAPPWLVDAVGAINADKVLLSQLSPELGGLVSTLDAIARGQLRRPVARWTPGWMPVPEPQDDLAFAHQLLFAVETWLVERMGEIPDPVNPARPLEQALDRYRHYLVGYGEGGMLAYQLVAQMPSRWAALHVLGASIGGSDPAAGVSGLAWVPTLQDTVSLFAHHGGSDLVQPAFGPTPEEFQAWNDLDVPPGAPGDTSTTELTPPNEVNRLIWPPDGVPTAVSNLDSFSAQAYAQRHRTLSFATDVYQALDGCTARRFEARQPDRLGLGRADRWVWSRAPTPDVTDNPVVIEYRDPWMNHTNWFETEAANQYVTVHTIWAWLFDHPKVA